jgi:outer membrane protein OmpA-like peptidoglycan-associated protein
MYRCKPSKWILPAVLGLGLPFLLGWKVSLPGISKTFEANCSTALSGVGADWAKCAVDGLSAKITGEAPDEEAVKTAVGAVGTIRGLRGVETATTIAPPVVLPVVETIAVAPEIAADAEQTFKGKWPSTQAKTLEVKINETNYELGKSPELTATGDDWSLNLGKTLTPGDYQLVTRITDGKKAETISPPIKFAILPPPPAPEVKVEEPAKVEEPVKRVILDPPAAPTVDRISSGEPITMITGTFPADRAKRLHVNVNGTTYSKNSAGSAITTEGNTWKLTLAEPLGNGSYSVKATIADEEYRVQSDATDTELIVFPGKTTPADAIKLVDHNAPTVANVMSREPVSVLTGTWDSTNAKRLRVKVPAQNVTAKLGDGKLSNEGDTWTLKLDQPLPVGVHEVVATSSDADFRSKSDSSSNEVRVIEVAAEAFEPTINRQSTDQPISMISGTWDSKNAKRLRVVLPVRGETYRLGAADGALTADGDTWTLKLAEPLGPGSYEVNAWTADGEFRTKADTSSGELIVGPPPAKPADPIAAFVMAGPTVNSMKSTQPVRAITGRWDSANAKRMRVSVAGQSVRSGNPKLITMGDSWTWLLDTPLEVGQYEVVVSTSDDNFRPKADATSNEIVVVAPQAVAEPAPAEPAPAAPAEAPKPIVSDVKIPEARPINCVAVMKRIGAVFPVYFDTNKVDLKDRGQLAVQQYISLLKDPRCAAIKVSVSGHADLRGTVKYNQRLSDGRVATVMKALTDAGIAADRFNAKGFSELQPADAGKSEEALAKNRRVDINVIE